MSVTRKLHHPVWNLGSSCHHPSGFQTVQQLKIYLSADGCRPLPRCGGARWSGCPQAPCPSSTTESESSAADCGSETPSAESRRCCRPLTGRTGEEQRNGDCWNRRTDVTEGWRMVDMQIVTCSFTTWVDISNFPMETKISNSAIKIRNKFYILNSSSRYFHCFMVTKSK